MHLAVSCLTIRVSSKSCGERVNGACCAVVIPILRQVLEAVKKNKMGFAAWNNRTVTFEL